VSPSAVGDDDLAAIEAMAWGLPVVAPGGDARTDLVEDGATGVLFRPGDARDLAAALVQLAGDPAWAAALGASARRYAESRYGVDGAVDRALALYESTLRPAHA
jgi:glycosyltransferase involved in cell wall biosynthesis